MIYLIQFVNMAIPKAGVLFRSIPITLASILFAMGIAWVILKRRSCFSSLPRIFWILYSIVIVGIGLVALLNIQMLHPKTLLYIFVIILSPLAMLLSMSTDQMNTAVRVTAAALCVVGLVSSVQWILGLEFSTIPGIILAWGESWAHKPIALAGSGLLVKMPSTYQNGNLVASFCTIAIPLVLSWPGLQDRDQVLRFTGLVLGLTAILLSGARSAVYPFLIIWMVICVVYIKTHQWEGFKYLMMLFMVVLMVTTTLGSSPAGYESTYEFMTKRYIGETSGDSTANGRTTEWQQALSLYGDERDVGILTRQVLLGVDWRKSVRIEGLTGIGEDYGIIVMTSYTLLLFLAMLWWLRKDFITGLGMLILLGQFTIDSSFAQPPSLINYFFIGGLSCHSALARLDGSSQFSAGDLSDTRC